jgi:ADP-glucose pyrophosphorylase
VLGPDCSVGDGAILENSVLWRGVKVGNDARLEHCVVGEEAEIEAGERVIDKTVVRDKKDGR